MEPSRELSAAIARANKIREEEPIRVIGWLALGMGVLCWLAGWMFLVDIPDIFGPSREPSVAAIFVVGASIGLALALFARRVGGKVIRHSVAASVVNGLILAVALFRVIQWTVMDEPPAPTPSSYPAD